MGGNFFEYDGNLYRVAQESEKSYGNGVSIQCMEGNNFQEICHLTSSVQEYRYDFHTFNVHKDMIVADALKYNRLNLRKMAERIYYMFNPLK